MNIKTFLNINKKKTVMLKRRDSPHTSQRSDRHLSDYILTFRMSLSVVSMYLVFESFCLRNESYIQSLYHWKQTLIMYYTNCCPINWINLFESHFRRTIYLTIYLIRNYLIAIQTQYSVIHWKHYSYDIWRVRELMAKSCWRHSDV